MDLCCDIEDIHALWDELADFDAAHADEARNHLLRRLCELVGVDNVGWIGVVRLDDARNKGVPCGWRVRLTRQLHPSPQLAEVSRTAMRQIDAGQMDASVVANLVGAGTFRARRLRDMLPPAWFEGDYYRWYYASMDRHDCVWVCVPVNADVEIGYSFFRGAARAPFSEVERDTLAYALRGLRWFHCRQVLGHGIGIGDAPLTEGERRVLGGLLGGLSDKRIAAELGQSPYTTQEYVCRLYRKYGVSNRAGLMALWLGRALDA